MKKNLVDMKQPFGEVINHNVFGKHPVVKGSRNGIGPTTEVPNIGFDLPQSNADKAPNAHAEACAHGDNPFYWIGNPKE